MSSLTVRRELAWIVPAPPHFLYLVSQIFHFASWMSRPNRFLKPISYPSEFLVYKRTKLGFFLKGEFGRCSCEQMRRPFGWKHLKTNLSWGKFILDLEEEEKGDLNRRNEFHLHSSHLFLLFLIFNGFISPLYELISYARVFYAF